MKQGSLFSFGFGRIGTGQSRVPLPNPELLRSAPLPPKRPVGRPRKVAQQPNETEANDTQEGQAEPETAMAGAVTYKVHVILSLISVPDESQQADSQENDSQTGGSNPERKTQQMVEQVKVELVVVAQKAKRNQNDSF